jgi:hypothetical protein
MNLETYLKQATRGIWGKRKQDAILELRGNIEARIWTLEHQGKTQAEALEIALQELGDARAVNAGMTQVHTMPNVTRNILLAGLISSVAAVGWTSSTAQIQTVTPSIAGVCCELTEGIQNPKFLSLNDLKTRFAQANVSIEETMQAPESAEEYWSGWPDPNAQQTRTLKLHFPEMSEGETVSVQAIPRQSVNQDGQNPQFTAGEDVFISPKSLVDQLRVAHLPMFLQGWHNPTFRIGQTSVMIGSKEHPVIAANWYSNTVTESLGPQMDSLSNAIFAWNQHSGRFQGRHIYSMRVDALPGTVYAIFTPMESPGELSITSGSNQAERDWIEYSLARVDDRGVLQFVDGAWKVIEFVQTSKDIADDINFLKSQKYDPIQLKKLGYGSAKRPAKAMLVRLTGRLDMDTTEIVVPAKPRLMASPW